MLDDAHGPGPTDTTDRPSRDRPIRTSRLTRTIDGLKPLAIGLGFFAVATLYSLALHGAGLIKALDLAGIFCFAYPGACVGWASTVRFKPITRITLVFLAALATACGGGALLRNPILYSNFVPYFLIEPEYLAMVGIAVVFSALDLEARLARHDDVAAAADAAANGLFTFTSATAALAHFGPEGMGIIWAVLAGTFSAAGGGALRDLILDTAAARFRGVFVTLLAPYRYASLIGAILVVALSISASDYAWVGAVVGAALAYFGRNLRLTP